MNELNRVRLGHYGALWQDYSMLEGEEMSEQQRQA